MPFILSYRDESCTGFVGWTDYGDLFITQDQSSATTYKTELDAKVDLCQIAPGDYTITITEISKESDPMNESTPVDGVEKNHQ